MVARRRNPPSHASDRNPSNPHPEERREATRIEGWPRVHTVPQWFETARGLKRVHARLRRAIASRLLTMRAVARDPFNVPPVPRMEARRVRLPRRVLARDRERAAARGRLWAVPGFPSAHPAAAGALPRLCLCP